MDPFLGEIRLMSFPFAPKGWMYCQGQLLSVSQNQALFSLLGAAFGGNGINTFALPDLRGRTIIGVGQGTGLSAYQWGQSGGMETVQLVQTQIPQHTHTFAGTLRTGDAADSPLPQQTFPAPGSQTLFASGSPTGTMNQQTLSGSLANAGASAPHENRQPLLVLNYAIAITGVYPSRS